MDLYPPKIYKKNYISFAGEQYAINTNVNCWDGQPKYYFRIRDPNNPQDCIGYCNDRLSCGGFSVFNYLCTFKNNNCGNVVADHGGTVLYLKKGMKVISENKC